jgi:hypothetical protein
VKRGEEKGFGFVVAFIHMNMHHYDVSDKRRTSKHEKNAFNATRSTEILEPLCFNVLYLRNERAAVWELMPLHLSAHSQTFLLKDKNQHRKRGRTQAAEQVAKVRKTRVGRVEIGKETG